MSGCGGAGQEQNVIQLSATQQDADSKAKAQQDATNANVPFSLSGGSDPSGNTSASQTATNTASSTATNTGTTTQTATPTQSIGGSNDGSNCSCGGSGLGGSGQEQNVLQASLTKQDADSEATAKQDATNVDVPISIAGFGQNGEDPSASQTLTNTADSTASNDSTTNQKATPTQSIGGSKCGCSASGVGGNGQEQNVVQLSATTQDADSEATAKQDAVDANAPFSLSGGWSPSGSGDSSSSQNASNSATSKAPNTSHTTQSADVKQLLGGSDNRSECGCGQGSGLAGNGQEQNVLQLGFTDQKSDSEAEAKQHLTNADVPVTVWLGKEKKVMRE
jgi:hypothetical protein